MKRKTTPLIRLNGGKPVALCNRCSVIMCYLSCDEKDGEFCKIKEVNMLDDLKYTSTPIGEEPPIYCDRCDLFYNYSLN